jgi:hypothetical protein
VIRERDRRADGRYTSLGKYPSWEPEATNHIRAHLHVCSALPCHVRLCRLVKHDRRTGDMMDSFYHDT